MTVENLKMYLLITDVFNEIKECNNLNATNNRYRHIAYFYHVWGNPYKKNS